MTVRAEERSAFRRAASGLSGGRRAKVAYRNGKLLAPVWQLRYEYARSAAVNPTRILRPSAVDGKEVAHSISYNDAGQPLQMIESGWSPTAPGKPLSIARTTTMHYSSINGRSVLVQIDGPQPNGPLNSPVDSDITRYEYDATGSMVQRVHSPGNMITEVMERDDAMRVTLTRTNDGVRLLENSKVLDYRGLPLNMTQRASFGTKSNAGEALARTTHFTYDGFGRMASVTKPDGTTLRTEFDADGHPTALIDALGNRADSRFDSEGKLVAMVTKDARGAVIGGMLNLWDDQNRLRARLNPLGLDRARGPSRHPGETVSYDANLEVSAVAEQGGQTHMLAEDNSTRELHVGRAGMQFIDGANRAHAMLVDDFGRVVFEVTPDAGSFTFEYGPNFLEKVHTSIDGGQLKRERLTFHPNGRLAKRTLGSCTESFFYEGDLLMRLDGCGNTQRYERNAFGLIVAHHQSMAKHAGQSAALVFTSTYAYDPANGQMTERRLPDGQRLVYNYSKADGSGTAILRDAGWLAWIDHYLGRPVAAALRGIAPGLALEPVVGDVVRRPFGGVASYKHGNGVRAARSFDVAGKLTGIDITTPAGPLEILRYRYNASGTVQTITRNGAVIGYEYDSMRRLILERPMPPAASKMASAAVAGVTLTDASVFSAVYSALGERRIGAQHAMRDAFGRQSAHGRQLLRYDDAHRLTAVLEDGKTIASYRYDALGNRIAKTVGAETTFFLYDSARRLVAEADAGGRVETQYLYIDNEPVAMMRANGGARTRDLYSIHADARGLPLAVTDDERNVVWRAQFDAFGNLRQAPVMVPVTRSAGPSLVSEAHAAAPASFAIPLRMAGQYSDTETGLYYNVHRYYDPAQGRYITPDPTGLAGGEHAYQYAGGDPLGKIDPLGLFEIPLKFLLGDPFQMLAGEPLWDLPVTDNGHSDIVRVAFTHYMMQNPGRFSNHTIDWVIRNVYHTDANGPGCLVLPLASDPTLPWVNGGGQCNAKAHFDNPNDGPMYTGKVDLDDPARNSMLTDSYKDGRDDNWIADSLTLRETHQADYTKVLGKDISWSLSAFGANLHATADFYSHSNWVDQTTRGGVVSNSYTIKDGDGKQVKKTECGWIPPGLNQTRLWNGRSDDIKLSHLFTGTVLGPGQTARAGTLGFPMRDANTVCGMHSGLTDYGDLQCHDDETTHGYWAKDHENELAPGEAPYTSTERAGFDADNLYFWEVQEYAPRVGPESLGNPKGKFGVDWYADYGETNLPRGARIYVRRSIRTRHEMAMALAIKDTQREIDKLWQASRRVSVGNLTLEQVFAAGKDAKDANDIIYIGKHSKL